MGGDMPLQVIRGIFNDDQRFVRAISAMLEAKEIRLLTKAGEEVPRWRWREVLVPESEQQAGTGEFLLSLTDAGARRME